MITRSSPLRSSSQATSSRPRAASLTLVVSGGRTIPVPFGSERFYVIDVTGADAADIRAHGVSLVADDAAGTELARLTVPSDWDAGAAEVERQTTSDVTTRSDSSDFTKVLGIDGVLRDPRPASLQLVYDRDHTVASRSRRTGASTTTSRRIAKGNS